MTIFDVVLLFLNFFFLQHLPFLSEKPKIGLDEKRFLAIKSLSSFIYLNQMQSNMPVTKKQQSNWVLPNIIKCSCSAS